MNFRLPYPNIFSSAPDFLLGLAFLATWIDPKSIGDDMVPYLFQVMVLEFIIVHSAGFMGVVIYGNYSKLKKINILLGLGLVYTLFVIAFAMGFNSWWPVITFWGLMFNRMMSVLSGQASEGNENTFVKNIWGMNIGCYVISMFIAILLPLPAFGVSPNDVAHLNVTGDFVDQPQKMIAWGFLYFSLVAWCELKMPSWINKTVTA